MLYTYACSVKISIVVKMSIVAYRLSSIQAIHYVTLAVTMCLKRTTKQQWKGSGQLLVLRIVVSHVVHVHCPCCSHSVCVSSIHWQAITLKYAVLWIVMKLLMEFLLSLIHGLTGASVGTDIRRNKFGSSYFGWRKVKPFWTVLPTNKLQWQPRISMMLEDLQVCLENSWDSLSQNQSNY